MMDHTEYYIFNSHAPEWAYVISKIGVKAGLKQGDIFYALHPGDVITFYMPRRVDPQLIASALGQNVDKIAASKLITLPFIGDKTLPKPTVQYFGEA